MRRDWLDAEFERQRGHLRAVAYRMPVASRAILFRGGADRAEPVIVNGAEGLMVRFPARSIVGAFTVANGRIVEIDIIADPDKFRGLGLV